MVAIDQVDDDPLALIRRRAQRPMLLVGLVANRALPEPVPAGRDVEVELLTMEIGGVGRNLLAHPPHIRLGVPAVQHRQPRPGVAQAEPHVDAAIVNLDHSSVPRNLEPVVVAEAHVLDRLILPRWDEHGS